MKLSASLTSALCVLVVQAAPQKDRITKSVDNRQRIALHGHMHPKARPENDQGRVSPSLDLSYVTLALAPSATQQVELDQLLAGQQTPGSPNYHHWLTPEEYAQRFGVSDADMGRITAWLKTQGLNVAAVARGRNWVAVNGTAAQIESAFQTELHEYNAGGETHFANASEPTIPAAFADVIAHIRGLNDFRAKPAQRTPRVPEASLNPDYTTSKGNHYLAPDDWAAIYNITPLYAAGINGSGQRLVVAGQTQINLTDVETFRSSYNLPANDPQVILVPNTRDPGFSSGDVAEANLDLDWSGAVARNATILYVYTSDVMTSIQYAIDQNLAPVISSSYGLCELETPQADAATFRAWAKQGNAQGITWFSASGDSGGADCGDSQNPGLSVDTPASIPEVTGIGGTEFAEGAGQFWNAANTASQGSVLSYIPETTWNDSAQDGQPSSGGGGASVYFSQPSWQTAAGAPGDNARHVPDIALTASADHDGYLVYTNGKLQVYGGTSAPTPAFAGVTALLNQYLVSSGAQTAPGVGNMNPGLYALAQSGSGVFHDITTGDNIVTVPCPLRARNCTTSAVGYSAGPGYDSVTGLGSVDGYALVTRWNGAGAVLPTGKTTITLVTNLASAGNSDVVFLTASATGSNGATPSGTVSFQVGGNSLGTAPLVGSAGKATATLAVNGSQLQGGGTITAVYTDSSSNSVSASVTVSVSGSGSTAKPSIAGLANGASFKISYAPGMILSVFGSQLAPNVATASSVPLPVSMAGVAATVNGVAAPLYYVSPGQVNLQIPYDTAVNSPATLTINNNGQITTHQINLSSAAPGIFTDQNGVAVPNGTASRGQIVTLFITGTGAVTPAVATGAAPDAGLSTANLPKPQQNLTVTVGSMQATVEFAGIPAGLVGVTQVNYQVPASVNVGPQAVTVSIGGVPSASVVLNVTN